MKSNSPNRNASVHDFHSLQIFVIFKRFLPIPKTYSVVVSSKIFYLSHLALQSIWNSFCLWNKVGIKGFFFSTRIPSSPIPFIGKIKSHCTAVSPHKPADHRVVLRALFCSRVHLYLLKTNTTLL